MPKDVLYENSQKLIRKKRDKENRVVSEMIKLYCKKRHGKVGICEECMELTDYCKKRIEQCPFMEEKTFCNQCKVHCYSKEMQEKIRKVMRFSGPRMLIYHPIMAIHHLIETIKNKNTK